MLVNAYICVWTGSVLAAASVACLGRRIVTGRPEEFTEGAPNSDSAQGSMKVLRPVFRSLETFGMHLPAKPPHTNTQIRGSHSLGVQISPHQQSTKRKFEFSHHDPTTDSSVHLLSTQHGTLKQQGSRDQVGNNPFSVFSQGQQDDINHFSQKQGSQQFSQYWQSESSQMKHEVASHFSHDQPGGLGSHSSHLPHKEIIFPQRQHQGKPSSPLRPKQTDSSMSPLQKNSEKASSQDHQGTNRKGAFSHQGHYSVFTNSANQHGMTSGDQSFTSLFRFTQNHNMRSHRDHTMDHSTLHLGQDQSRTSSFRKDQNEKHQAPSFKQNQNERPSFNQDEGHQFSSRPFSFGLHTLQSARPQEGKLTATYSITSGMTHPSQDKGPQTQLSTFQHQDTLPAREDVQAESDPSGGGERKSSHRPHTRKASIICLCI